ncbi:MAG: aspartate aminotransferase family protein, partial [Lachnospiraceae bacterium]
NKTEYMEMGEKNILHVYNRYKLVLEKGEGVYLYDTEGKKYLDFAAGIAVSAFGYNNKKYNDALKDQIDKLIHVSNLFYNIPSIEAAQKIVKATGFDRVFFTNSGAEAIEGALKLAKKYAYNKKGSNDYEIIAMNHSFHGRTIGALSVTGNSHYREPFMPLMPGVKFAEYNDLDSVKELISDKTCAIILETIQGEGGIYPATEEFIKGIRRICDDNNIIMICDEIQCGMGRTGKLYAFEHYGIKPDVFTTAKALGCGVPVGAFVARGEVADAMVPGDHGTTYGGNPLACAAVSRVYDMFESHEILSHVNEVGRYLEEKLEEISKEFPCIIERRGKGLLQGLALKKEKSAGEVINKAMDNGLIIISAGGNVLRFVPPLIITKENVDEMTEILRKSL